MEPLITLILPVYNASSTLPRMIESLLAQTLTNWELLIINDGSTDNSSILCNQYASQDSRIHVFYQKNAGVAMARQIGVDNAHGIYSIHIDADDWVESTMLEKLYLKAKEADADVVIADYFINSFASEIIVKQQPSLTNPHTVLQDMFKNKIFGALWHKLVRTDLYRKYNLRFFYGINHCEDLLIWVQLLQHKNIKIVYLPQAFYHYWINNNSITHNFTRKTYEIRLKFRDKLNDLLHLSNASEIMAQVSFSIFTEGFIYNILTKEEIKDGLNLYKNKIKDLKSLKWRLGFIMLSYGMSNFAHKLIHY